MRTVAIAAALLGGASWVAHAFVPGGAESARTILLWDGIALLALAVLVVAGRLVRQPLLQAVSALGGLLLGVALVELLRGWAPGGTGSTGDDAVLGAVGGLAVVAAVVTLAVRVGRARRAARQAPSGRRIAAASPVPDRRGAHRGNHRG